MGGNNWKLRYLYPCFNWVGYHTVPTWTKNSQKSLNSCFGTIKGYFKNIKSVSSDGNFMTLSELGERHPEAWDMFLKTYKKKVGVDGEIPQNKLNSLKVFKVVADTNKTTGRVCYMVCESQDDYDK